MYVFQMSDGRYAVDILTNSKLITFSAIYKNAEATQLFDQTYVTRVEATTAIDRIKQLAA